MSEAAQRATAYATIALGTSQALIPRQAGVAFGMGDIDDPRTLWLARLLGIANVGLGLANLNPATRRALRPQTIGILAADAAFTAVAGIRRELPVCTALSVIGFVAALVPGVLGDE
jgi:hypothetical protein